MKFVLIILLFMAVSCSSAQKHKRQVRHDSKVKNTPSAAKLSSRDATNVILFFLFGAFLGNIWDDIEQFLIGGKR